MVVPLAGLKPFIRGRFQFRERLVRFGLSQRQKLRQAQDRRSRCYRSGQPNDGPNHAAQRHSHRNAPFGSVHRHAWPSCLALDMHGLEHINKGVAKKARTHCGLLPFLHTLVFIDASARTPLATMMPRHRPGPGPNLTKHVRICTNAVRSLGRRDIVSIVTNFR